MKPDLEKAGERIITQRAPYEVSEELKLVSAQLQKLQDLPDDAEKIYRDYTGNLEGLKGKLQELQDNKKLMLLGARGEEEGLEERGPEPDRRGRAHLPAGALDRRRDGGDKARRRRQRRRGGAAAPRRLQGRRALDPRPIHAERRREVGRARRVHALAPEQDNLAPAGDGRVRHPHGPAQQGGDLQDDPRAGEEEPQLAAHRDNAVDNLRRGQDRARHHRPVRPRLVSSEGVRQQRRKIARAQTDAEQSAFQTDLAGCQVFIRTNAFF